MLDPTPNLLFLLAHILKIAYLLVSYRQIIQSIAQIVIHPFKTSFKLQFLLIELEYQLLRVP